MGDGSGSSVDFLGQYRAISNKLKKRFLRKPNVTEASDQFGALALRCERDELPQYAGLCWMAAARCEGSLSNNPGEAWDLVRGARQFMAAEVKGARLGCPSPGGEHLQAAVSCYSHAATKWQQHQSCEHTQGLPQPPSPLAAGLSLELGHALRVDLNRVGEAATEYKHAAELQRGSPLEQLNSLGLLASCQIELGDYDGALSTFNEMVTVTEVGSRPTMGAYSDILHRCEVTRVLLLLILQPSAQRLPPDLAQVLEKYAWGEEGSVPVSYLSEDEFLLLQSLVMACQSRDVESLCSLEAELWSHLSSEQRGLLRTLVRQMFSGPK
ncbi:40-kDa huntingtin-associated protein [Anabrus simplex]|uniref:40-kDa huntingtin-associated protein n=1 Tax=Anabrus simplex TaxID=316456 RepID=UPI0034DD6953